MQTYIYFLVFIQLAALASNCYLDFKERKVLLSVLILLFASNILYVTELLSLQDALLNIAGNSVLLLAYVTLIGLYVFLRFGKNELFQKYLGVGDVVFLFSVTPLFALYNFILYQLIGLVFTLIVWLVLQQTQRDWVQSRTIPLAGVLSALLFFLLLYVNYAKAYSVLFTPIIS